MDRDDCKIAFVSPHCLVDFTTAPRRPRDALRYLATNGFACEAYCGTRLDDDDDPPDQVGIETGSGSGGGTPVRGGGGDGGDGAYSGGDWNAGSGGSDIQVYEDDGGASPGGLNWPGAFLDFGSATQDGSYQPQNAGGTGGSNGGAFSTAGSYQSQYAGGAGRNNGGSFSTTGSYQSQTIGGIPSVPLAVIALGRDPGQSTCRCTHRGRARTHSQPSPFRTA